ncbi:HAD family hydrolase [Chloroflexota bacterium]
MNLPNFTKPPGAVAIDLDGTLLNSQTLLSERNRKAVEVCIDWGIPVIIATQRAARTVRRILGDEFCKYCSMILLNGAFAQATSPLSGYVRELMESSLVKDITEAVLRIDSRVRILTETGENEFGTNKPLDPDELWKVNAAKPEMQLSLDAVTTNVVKILVDGQSRDLSSMITAISQRFGDLVSVVPALGNTIINITNMDVSKPSTLNKLLKTQQIGMDDTVAIGDDIPDLEMLTACGISVAMENAIPEVKAVAKYQTASNNEDGVAFVLEEILSSFTK